MNGAERPSIVERVRGALARALDPAATENEARSALEVAFTRARRDRVTLPELGASGLEGAIERRIVEAIAAHDAREQTAREELLRRAIECAYERGMSDAFAVMRTPATYRRRSY